MSFRATQVTATEQEAFAQKTRLTHAEQALVIKPTKTAAEDQRIATKKIRLALERLEELQQDETPRSGGGRSRRMRIHRMLVALRELTLTAERS